MLNQASTRFSQEAPVGVRCNGRLALKVGAYRDRRDLIQLGIRRMEKKLRREWYRFYVVGFVGACSWSALTLAEAVSL
jgi:hypothetical protein